MNYFLQILILLVAIGWSKAHFVRIVILAGLGLAALWMIHTLAQDYNKITNQNGGGGKFFEKRSTDSQRRPSINWDYILSRDPASCARSFICQLSAQNDGNLGRQERNILELTRHFIDDQKNWASRQLREALRMGGHFQSPADCLNIYKYCPFTSKTMMSLLRLFGS